MRELHGPLRLRADRGDGQLCAPDRSSQGGIARRADRRWDGAGNLARAATPGAVRVLTPRPEDAGEDRGAQGPGQASGDQELTPGAPPSCRGQGGVTSAPAWGAGPAIV